MIPSRPIDGCPPGELALFHALESDTGTKDWIVFHGLEIANHVANVAGEADFVVLVPGHGILTVEVKSHKSARRSADGLWHLGNSAPVTRSPFKQAADAHFSIKKFLGDRGFDTHGFPMWHVVWFTSLQRNDFPKSVEWHEWELLDARDLSLSASASILRTLTAAAKHLKSSVVGIKLLLGKPTDEDVERAAFLLRQEFVAEQSASQAARERQSELASFLPEQLRVLDYVRAVPRIAVRGAAGTGKTYIAVEAARRFVASGASTLLVTFNRPVAEHIATFFAPNTQNVTVTTIHALMLKIADVKVPDSARDPWWRAELPQLAVAKILENSSHEAPFEALVVDEAQDIFSADYADFLDLIVKGGLSNGKSVIVGDFAHQAIYAPGAKSLELLKKSIPDVVALELTVNCRNSRAIGATTNLLARLAPGYELYRRPDEGELPRIKLQSNTTEFANVLEAEIKYYLSQNYSRDEIVILSPRNDSTAAKAGQVEGWFHANMSKGFSPSRLIRYGTIHQFKGLESPVVIVTDIDRVNLVGFHDLLYVALTRATHRLSIVGLKQTMRALQEMEIARDS